MPPRRRPAVPATAVEFAANSPRAHLDPFLHYLRAECGMSDNTIAAYGTDLR
ncbi:MAG: site-specific tyrosine recombinase XerD, partial [Planctomycetota bacterium]